MNNAVVALTAVAVSFFALAAYVIVTNRWHERKRHAH